MVFTNRGENKVVEVLQYAQQGQLVGSDPIDVENARRLNEAAELLNDTLRKM